MERMARLGLGVMHPVTGLAVLAQVLTSAWRRGPHMPAQSALLTGAPLLLEQTCYSYAWSM